MVMEIKVITSKGLFFCVCSVFLNVFIGVSTHLPLPNDPYVSTWIAGGKGVFSQLAYISWAYGSPVSSEGVVSMCVFELACTDVCLHIKRVSGRWR